MAVEFKTQILACKMGRMLDYTLLSPGGPWLFFVLYTWNSLHLGLIDKLLVVGK